MVGVLFFRKRVCLSNLPCNRSTSPLMVRFVWMEKSLFVQFALQSLYIASDGTVCLDKNS